MKYAHAQIKHFQSCAHTGAMVYSQNPQLNS